MFTIDWSSWNKPITKETCIEDLNRYVKYKHINKTLYKKALDIIEKGFQCQYYIKDNGHAKVIKVTKSNKL